MARVRWRRHIDRLAWLSVLRARRKKRWLNRHRLRRRIIIDKKSASYCCWSFTVDSFCWCDLCKWISIDDGAQLHHPKSTLIHSRFSLLRFPKHARLINAFYNSFEWLRSRIQSVARHLRFVLDNTVREYANEAICCCVFAGPSPTPNRKKMWNVSCLTHEALN